MGILYSPAHFVELYDAPANGGCRRAPSGVYAPGCRLFTVEASAWYVLRFPEVEGHSTLEFRFEDVPEGDHPFAFFSKYLPPVVARSSHVPFCGTPATFSGHYHELGLLFGYREHRRPHAVYKLSVSGVLGDTYDEGALAFTLPTKIWASHLTTQTPTS